jgi:hypothetical protein
LVLFSKKNEFFIQNLNGKLQRRRERPGAAAAEGDVVEAGAALKPSRIS